MYIHICNVGAGIFGLWLTAIITIMMDYVDICTDICMHVCYILCMWNIIISFKINLYEYDSIGCKNESAVSF